MRFAHRTRFARTFATREEFFPKMRFPGKMIGFLSASAEAELCEAGERKQRGPFLSDHLPRPGHFLFPVQQLQEATFTTHLKLLYRASQVSYSPRVQGPQALALSVRFPESGLPPGRA